MKFLVGCPVTGRNWILPQWKEAVLRAFENLEQPEFIFVIPEDDEATKELIAEWEEVVHIVESDEPVREDQRYWNKARYQHMAGVRNLLLARVRELEPEFFLSLDSDILLAGKAVESALKVQAETGASAVGLKVYLSLSGRLNPNMGLWATREVTYSRYDMSYAGRVDILMAAKLMTPSAYNVDYQYNDHGEDLGWSKAAGRAGCKLYWDPSYPSKHIMKPEQLGVVDRRIGW